jgi:hypothetical protein
MCYSQLPPNQYVSMRSAVANSKAEKENGPGYTQTLSNLTFHIHKQNHIQNSLTQPNSQWPNIAIEVGATGVDDNGSEESTSAKEESSSSTSVKDSPSAASSSSDVKKEADSPSVKKEIMC